MNSASTYKKNSYVVITPVRDEMRHIEDTIKCVVQQTITPTEWVIVDDGSTDGTDKVLDRYAGLYPWIHPIHKTNRGFRDADVGAVQAFLDGFHSLKPSDWEFVVNLDGDLGFDPPYFEKCFEEFHKDPKVGIGGGTICCRTATGAMQIERTSAFHVRGATKIYKHVWWDTIGGLAAVPGWDTLDEVKTHMAGGAVRSFANLMVLHRRATGAAGGSWRDSVKNGHCDYFLGYHPIFMLLKCLRRVFRKPFLVNAAGHLCGFIGGYLSRRAQVADEALIRYVRRQQMRRLLFMESTWR